MKRLFLRSAYHELSDKDVVDQIHAMLRSKGHEAKTVNQVFNALNQQQKSLLSKIAKLEHDRLKEVGWDIRLGSFLLYELSSHEDCIN